MFGAQTLLEVTCAEITLESAQIRNENVQVLHPLAEPEEALDRGQRSCSRDGCQAGLNQRSRYALEIAQGQTAQRLRRMIEKTGGIAPVAPARVCGLACRSSQSSMM
jgi:hypothetical protein